MFLRVFCTVIIRCTETCWTPCRMESSGNESLWEEIAKGSISVSLKWRIVRRCECEFENECESILRTIKKNESGGERGTNGKRRDAHSVVMGEHWDNGDHLEHLNVDVRIILIQILTKSVEWSWTKLYVCTYTYVCMYESTHVLCIYKARKEQAKNPV
jgi:hypothetical protein